MPLTIIVHLSMINLIIPTLLSCYYSSYGSFFAFYDYSIHHFVEQEITFFNVVSGAGA